MPCAWGRPAGLLAAAVLALCWASTRGEDAAEAPVVWGDLLPGRVLAAAGLAEGFHAPTHLQPNETMVGALTRGAADAVVVDAGPLPPLALAATELLQVPVLALGVAPVVNLPPVPPPSGGGSGPPPAPTASPMPVVTLSLPLLAAVLAGAVTRWDDPAVVALNPFPNPVVAHPMAVFALAVSCERGATGGRGGGCTCAPQSKMY
jgi:hypothetical protein